MTRGLVRRTCRWFVRLGVVLAMLGFVTLGLAGRSTAQSQGRSFDAGAAAYGVDVQLRNPSIPVLPAIQMAGPTADAQAGSIRGARAFASFPYPGDVAVGLPGLLAAVFGVPLPAYPAYAQAEDGDRPAEVTFPGVELRAESRGGITQARALAGDGAAGSTSAARIEVDDTIIASRAESSFAFGLGKFLTISGVRTSASAVLGPSGEVEIATGLDIGRVSVPALELRIPEETPGTIPVPVPGLSELPPVELPPVPLPFAGEVLEAPDLGFRDGRFVVFLPVLGGQTYDVPSDVIVDALAAAGIDAEYQPAQPLTDESGAVIGVVGASLTLRTVLPAPPENTFYNEPTEVVMAFGRATAVVDAAGGSGFGAPDLGGSGTFTPDQTGAPSSAGVPTGAISPGPGAANTTGDRAAAPGEPTGPRQSLTAFREPLARDVLGIYLVIVGVALVGLGSAGAVRVMGVRNAWS